MIKLCDDYFLKNLSIIFKHYIGFGVFSDSWEKPNIVLIDIQNDKQLINNYRPVSLLPICSKIFGKIVFNWDF